MKSLAVTLLFAACACESSKPPPPTPDLPQGLRVPLPDGWKATAVGGDLHAGPQGRAVIKLEKTQRPMPTIEQLVTAIEATGAVMQQKESISSFVGVRYSIGVEGDDAGRRDAFLGVRQTGPRTIWCSTTASARRDEVEAAMTVCRSLSWEG